jgi:lysophospholipid acyltransferase (LPLAT)-like uncharacterized protein
VRLQFLEHTSKLIFVPQTFTQKQRIILAVVPRVASLLIRCLGVTLRYRDVCGPGAFAGYDSPPPAVYAFWHRCLLASAWRFRNRGVAILISRSFDGELIARTVERLGFIAIRGSSSRDAVTALRSLQRAYLDGHYCAITADGPRGPSMIAKPGVAQLAKMVDTTVGAFYVHPERAWELNSWDRFLIPKPFSRVTIAWAARVEPNGDAVQEALNDSVQLASQK